MKNPTRRVPTAVSVLPGEIEAVRNVFGEDASFSSIVRYGLYLAVCTPDDFEEFKKRENESGTVFGVKTEEGPNDQLDLFKERKEGGK